MQYAKVENGVVVKVGPRPPWLEADGAPVSDTVLRAGGYEVDEKGALILDESGAKVLATGRPGHYPVQPPPSHDPATHKLVPIPMDQWQVNETDVGPTHEVVPLTADELAAMEAEAQSARRALVDQEHDRRASAGKSFTVTGYGDVALEGSLRTQTVLLALKDTARDLINASVTDPVLMLTDRDNVDHYLTPSQVVELVNAGKQYMQELHAAKRALKEMQPVPADLADDGYWPGVA
ncbi:hypothetical protein [Pseudorhizobium flavum]|uniref:DUF4376 domain-containing protein n=1 Tax=Pseudorhizobium flavum TaxID=1335061 RepID=UPI00248FDFAC|nr:hypothetical protein [Pseudorhizobium flavum]